MIIVVIKTIKYENNNNVTVFSSWYITIELIAIAAIGKTKAHHDMKNFIFKKFLYINAIKSVKNIAILNNILAKISI